MISVVANDADKIAGLLNLNAALMQRILDLEINLAATKRALVEKDVTDATLKGEGIKK